MDLEFCYAIELIRPAIRRDGLRGGAYDSISSDRPWLFLNLPYHKRLFLASTAAVADLPHHPVSARYIQGRTSRPNHCRQRNTMVHLHERRGVEDRLELRDSSRVDPQ
jgi:hypothetical protein